MKTGSDVERGGLERCGVYLRVLERCSVERRSGGRRVERSGAECSIVDRHLLGRRVFEKHDVERRGVKRHCMGGRGVEVVG